ncbi:hypothetical protein MPLSOD_150026 [Mesorhizobium sp. SOD10]|nr:hypothetical protein MPLSOD_150026 [Mesorhizobium sp. SOD10]
MENISNFQTRESFQMNCRHFDPTGSAGEPPSTAHFGAAQTFGPAMDATQLNEISVLTRSAERPMPAAGRS